MVQQFYSDVLIFGATGEVGSAAALEASSRGAKVWLGMRNIEKENRWLPIEDEEAGKMTRINADLTDPTSLTKAVEGSGAKAAYIYSVRSTDHMKTSLSALKQAGIEHIVFLSTNAIRRAWAAEEDLHSIKPSYFVPWKHAQVEIALGQLDIPHTVIRPGFFASNPFRMYLDKSTFPPRVRVLAPDVLNDPIDPVLIGRASGALLVSPTLGNELGFQKTEKKQIVDLIGPSLISQREQWRIVNEKLVIEGKEPVIFSEIGKEEYVANLTTMHNVPRPIAESLARSMSESAHDDADHVKSSKNIEKITGHCSTTFVDFVKRELSRYFE